MKTLLLSLLVLCCIPSPRFVKGHNFKGYIFPAEYEEVFIGGTRFTPTEADIKLAEKIITAQIKDADGNWIVNSSKDIVIHKKLHKYMRQYVGFINDKGERVIWVSALWNSKFIEERAGKYIISVSDGGSRYWNVDVNLNTQKLEKLSINGFG